MSLHTYAQAKATSKPAFTPAPTGLLQRKCACGGTPGPDGECAACRQKRLAMQRQALPAHQTAPSTIPPIVHDVLRSSGQPLEASTRRMMESRLGHDFSQVRVHTGAKAIESARAVDAQAYTVGKNIVFDAGTYVPHKPEGQRLLAHELAHVIQQKTSSAMLSPLTMESSNDSLEHEAEAASMRVERGEATGTMPLTPGGPRLSRQGRRGVPGGSTFEDKVTSAKANQQGVWEGTVKREESIPPEKEGGEREVIHRGEVHVRYDPNTCRVTIPVKVSFRQPTDADLGICPPYKEPGKGQPPTNKPLDDRTFRAVADQYIKTVNERLNGWYSVRFNACKGQPCTESDIPIQVEVTESDTDPDYTVTIANLEGRSCVSLDNHLVILYASGGSLKRSTMAHEGGHMALGVGDEYRETEHPETAYVERIRESDWSLMADSEGFGRWALLHERHFSFVPTFLNDVMSRSGHPGCKAELHELSRPTKIELRVSYSAGYAYYAGASGYQLGVGVDIGIPLNRLREWQLLIGAHGSLIGNLDLQSRSAFLVGLRVGFEHTRTPSSGGFRYGAFGEAGAGWFSSSLAAFQQGAYAEGGALLGYGFALSGGFFPYVQAEAAAGTRLDFNNPANERWFRAGLEAGFRF